MLVIDLEPEDMIT